MLYVLLIITATSSGAAGNGVTTHTQEFTSKDNCKAAKEIVQKTYERAGGTYDVIKVLECLPK